MTLLVLCALTFGVLPGGFALSKNQTPQTVSRTCAISKIASVTVKAPASKISFDAATLEIALKCENTWEKTGITEISLFITSKNGERLISGMRQPENKTDFEFIINDLLEQTEYKVGVRIYQITKDADGKENRTFSAEGSVTFTTKKMPPPPPRVDPFDHICFSMPDYSPLTQDNEYYYNYRNDWDLTCKKQTWSSATFNVAIYTKGDTWYSGFFDVKITVKDLYTRRMYIKYIKGREQQKSFDNITFGTPLFDYDDESSWKRVERGELAEPLNYWQDHEVLVEVFKNGQKITDKKAEYRGTFKTRFRLIEVRYGATIKNKDGSLTTKTFEFAKDDEGKIIQDRFRIYFTVKNIAPYSFELPSIDLWSDIDRDPPFNLCYGCETGPRLPYVNKETNDSYIYGYKGKSGSNEVGDPRELRTMVLYFELDKVFTLKKMAIPNMRYLYRIGVARYQNKEPFFPNGGGYSEILGKTFDNLQPKP